MNLALSPNFDLRAQDARIRYIVVHYTAMKTAQEALERLCDPALKISAHYLIDRDGALFKLVDEDKRAWHAGASFWRGKRDINSWSIGIELVNDGTEPFPKPQIEALKELMKDIATRHRLSVPFLLGHSDIAPTRKQDPGPLFPWKNMVLAGFDPFPDGVSCAPETDVVKALSVIGYECVDVAAALGAFQRRYRPSRVDGVADEETRKLLAKVREWAEQPPLSPWA